MEKLMRKFETDSGSIYRHFSNKSTERYERETKDGEIMKLEDFVYASPKGRELMRMAREEGKKGVELINLGKQENYTGEHGRLYFVTTDGNFGRSSKVEFIEPVFN